jgi:hypothetical protein
MASFNGVLSAPQLTVAPCGLLSVAFVVSHTDSPDDERWIRGFSSTSNGAPTVRVLTIHNDDVADGDLYDGSGVARHNPVFPFFIEVESKSTGFDLTSSNPLDTVADQIDSVTQKTVEHELWEGVAARSLSPTPGEGYLIEEGKATVVTTAGEDALRALALLEQSISESPTGSRGIIHMTRDVASTLGDHLLYKATTRDDEKAYAVTRLGTLVVIGSGYTGNGPIGAAGREASATNKWMFATAAVEVHLGAPFVVNESVAQSFNPRTNDSIVVAQRPVAVHFDPSIWYAAQVTLA